MRILHVFNYFLNRTEHWCLSLIKHLPGEQTIYAKRRIDLGLDDSLDLNIQEYKQADYFHFDKTVKRPSFIKFSARMMHKYFNNYANEIIKFNAKNRHDIIHIHFADIACETINKLSQTNLPIIVSFYGWDYLKLPFTKPSFRRKYKHLFERADALIVEGPHGKKLLNEKYNCPESKIHICPLGIEIKHPWKGKSKTAHGSFIQIASFRKKKGILNTLSAFKELLSKYPKARLCLIGDKGDKVYAEEISKFISASNMNQNIEILDFIAYEEIHSHLISYDAFIHPSVTTADYDSEGGAPTILFDAMQAGLPIVSTLHADIPFVLGSEDQRALLSKENDIKGLKDAMEKIIEMSQQSYDRHSKEQYGYLLDNFDIHKNVDTFKSLYEAILDSQKKSTT